MNGMSFWRIFWAWLTSTVAHLCFSKYYATVMVGWRDGRAEQFTGCYHVWGPFNFFSVRQTIEFSQKPFTQYDRAEFLYYSHISRSDYIFLLDRFKRNHVAELKP